jgi:DNA-binding transcriptional MerR regulator
VEGFCLSALEESSVNSIRIAQLARLFGISDEAIRKYEQKGVFDIRRNDQNRFREYDIWDTVTLFQARKYTQMGLSVSRSAQLLNDTGVSAVLGNIQERRQELSDEILFRQKLTDNLREWEQEIREWQETGRGFRFGMMPKVVFNKLFDSYALEIDTELLSRAEKLIRHLPYASLGVHIGRQNILDGIDVFAAGVCILKDDLDWAGSHDLSGETVFEPCRSVTTFISGRFNEPIKIQDFSPALRYIAEQGLELVGDVFAKVILTQRVKGEYCFHHKVWFPVEDKCPKP